MALLPIGLMAVFQTQRVAEQASENAELALLALTEKAASIERRDVRQATGAAATLAALVPNLIEDPEICSARMRAVTDRVPQFGFAGYIPTNGIMTCASSGAPYDFSDDPIFAEAMANPRPRVQITGSGPISGDTVLMISVPVFEPGTGAMAGYVTISTPYSSLSLFKAQDFSEDLLELVTFNGQGQILSTMDETSNVGAFLPEALTLREISQGPSRAIRAQDASGEERIYTFAPVEQGLFYVLGIWEEGAQMSGERSGQMLTVLFPALMWLVSLVVALMAVHRLLTRHLQRLGRQMALFAAARRLPDRPDAGDPPTEILRIQQAFQAMTDVLIRDEAAMENAVRAKSVLVKEIHHRVKNNLQLISSIINLQIRDSDNDETRQALRRTQDRVHGMATIHRDLYQTNESGLVNVGNLIREVVVRSVELSGEHHDVDLQIDVADVWLYPDQAVPLSLLASEGVINALKHMPEEGAGSRWLAVQFTEDGDEERRCTFEIRNETPAEPRPIQRPGGMGRKLIRAFATQLDADVRTKEAGGIFRLEVTFTASDFAPAPGAY